MQDALPFDLRHLEIFLQVCDSGTMVAAARVLGLTQPAVSQAVSELEARAGVALLDRAVRPLALTAAGLVLRPHAAALLAEARQIGPLLRRAEAADLPLLRAGAVGPPPPPPAEEARVRGTLHSRRRDQAAITHHYDVGDDFYRVLLGPSLVYSCAYFDGPATTLEQAQAFLAALPAGDGMMIKAIAGGGGRGMRAVHEAARLAEAYERCASEARAAFGDGALYVERLVTGARHVEVQVLGDAQARVAALGERECSLQRRHQKLVEVAPSPAVDGALRERLVRAALAIARASSPDAILTRAGTQLPRTEQGQRTRPVIQQSHS